MPADNPADGDEEVWELASLVAPLSPPEVPVRRRTRRPDGEVAPMPRGRPRQAFSRDAEDQAERRRMRKVYSRCETNAERIAEVEHELELARREMVRLLVRASDAGMTNAELGRIYSLTMSRISQMVKAAREG